MKIDLLRCIILNDNWFRFIGSIAKYSTNVLQNPTKIPIQKRWVTNVCTKNKRFHAAIKIILPQK